MIDLDLSGLKCPLPVLKTRKALSGLGEGDMLRVVCTDPLSVIDIPHMVHETGDEVLKHETEGSRQVFVIRRNLGKKKGPDEPSLSE